MSAGRRTTKFDSPEAGWLELQNGLDSRFVVRGAWCVKRGAAFVMRVTRFVAALRTGEPNRDARVVGGVGLFVRIGTDGLPANAIE